MKKLKLILTGLFFSAISMAALAVDPVIDPVVAPTTGVAVKFVDSGDLAATVVGLTTLVAAIAGAAIVHALTRMVLRKVRGFAGRAG